MAMTSRPPPQPTYGNSNQAGVGVGGGRMPLFDYDTRQPVQQSQQQLPPMNQNQMNMNMNMQQSRHQYTQSGSTSNSGGSGGGGFRYNNGGPPPNMNQNMNSGNMNQANYSPRSIPNGSLSNDDGINSYQNGVPNGIGPSTIQQQQQPSSSVPTKTRRPRPDTDEIRRTGRTHYQELLGFLKSHLAKNQQAPRSSAREKLTRLSKQQFTELSTDVYDELMRRLGNGQAGGGSPHLIAREEFHPKRNQARQKLSTLPRTRFKDLASDVFFELERRFPDLKEEFRPEAIAREKEMDARKAAEEEEERERQAREKAREDEEERVRREEEEKGLAPKPSTSDVIVPAKSTLVEEQIAVPYAKGELPNSKSGSGNARLLGGRGSNSSGSDEELDLDRSRNARRDSASTSAREMDGDENENDPNRNTMFSQSSVGTGFLNGYANSATGTQSQSSPHLGRASQAEGPNMFGIEKLRSDYEFRIATLQQRVGALESQNADLKESAESKAEEEKRRRDDLETLREENRRHQQRYDDKHSELEHTLIHLDKVKEDYDALMAERERMGGNESNEELRKEFEELQKEYSQQEDVVHELKGEVSSLIEELRQLSARNDEMMAEKDSDVSVIKDLNQQVTSYKRKYEQAKSELRSLKATSQLWVQPAKADELMTPTERGGIADVNLNAFQSSIDELLAAARSKTQSNVLAAMKTVVLATTLCTDDVVKFEQNTNVDLSKEDQDHLKNLKSKCSSTLNNLMTACRNHASSHGLSPVSLLDAAASHVSTTIVDMVRIVKIRKASKSEAQEYEATLASGGGPHTGLKPLHINAANSRSPSDPNAFSPGGNSNGATANGRPSVDERFNHSSKAEGLSPRTRNGPVMGRYSPVGYRPDITRKDSANGAGSWRSDQGDARRRAASVSSASSGVAPSVPAVPPISNALRSKSLTGNSTPSPRRRSRESGSNYRGSPTSPTSTGRLGLGSDGLDNTPPAMGGSPDDSGEENWAELRNYIEVQTEAIVHSIQALLSAIREGAQGVQLNENLTQITTIVSSIVAISKGNLPANSKSQGEQILAELTDNCDRLSEMQNHPTFDKSTKSAMASASYGVAKGLKALNTILNEATED